MLTELRIKNLALIESAEISFGPGFNALTGETGAGKSILLGAITLLLGGRASIDDIRTGEDMAFVEGVFEIAKVKSARELMARHGIPPEGDRLIVRREISRQGRNRIFLNASASPLSVLMAFGDVLIDVHGQHDHQSLLRPESHMETLDSFRDVEPVRKAYDEQYRIWNEAEATLRELLAKEKELLERKEFLLFRVEEIGKAAVRLDEDRQLEEELRILESAGKRFDLSAGIADRLVESESAVQSVLAECRKNAEALARIDPAAAVAAKGLESALIETGEAARFFSAYSRAVEHKPDRIEEIQERLSLLGRFKKKYGPSLEEVLSTYEKARIDLDRIENLDAHKAGLLSAAAREKKALSKAAAALSVARKKVADRFNPEITKNLRSLGMEDGRFAVQLEKTVSAEGLEMGGERYAFDATGADQAEMMFSANPGEPLKALARIASGGELSRVMLAIKSFLAQADRIPTLLFDEIDTGIGGVVAGKIGDALSKLGRTHQILCVTHLPTIAARAARHFVVDKRIEKGRARTVISQIGAQQRIEELARMLGDNDSQTALRHARELVEKGES